MKSVISKYNFTGNRREKKRQKDAKRLEIKNNAHICSYCGGKMTWCSCCNVYSATCCMTYGSCMCS